MPAERRQAEDRMRQLLLSIKRIEAGKSKYGAKLTISAVARESGVTPSLIHNSYPTIAALIRSKSGKRPSDRDEKLRECRRRAAELRQEIAKMKADLSKIATINEMLAIENQNLRAIVDAANVVPIRAPAGGTGRL